MGLQEWLTEFRVLHDKARSDKLSDHDVKLYKDGREELAAALVQAQRLTRKPQESAREALRVARAVQVDLELNSGKQRVVTLDICIGGFSTMMGVPPEPNEAVGVTMRMPEGKDPIVARRRSSAPSDRPRATVSRSLSKGCPRATPSGSASWCSTRRSRGWAASETGPRLGRRPRGAAAEWLGPLPLRLFQAITHLPPFRVQLRSADFVLRGSEIHPEIQGSLPPCLTQPVCRRQGGSAL
jgi:hypothetical protein